MEDYRWDKICKNTIVGVILCSEHTGFPLDIWYAQL